MMKNTKNDMPEKRSKFGAAKKSKTIDSWRPKGRFLGGPGGRGEDSSPFRLTSSLILHALHPGGVRRIQNEVKIELWALRDQIFGILGGFARGQIFDEFLIGLKIRKIPKNETEVRKTNLGRSPGQGSAAEAGSLERLWSLLNRQESAESCKSVWNALSHASRGRRI